MLTTYRSRYWHCWYIFWGVKIYGFQKSSKTTVRAGMKYVFILWIFEYINILGIKLCKSIGNWIIGMMHYSGIKSCSSMWGKLYTFWFLCWQLVKAMLIRSCLAKIFWQGGQVKSIQLLTTYSILYFRSPGIVSWMLNYHQCQHLPYQMRVSSSAILGKVKSFQIGKIVPKTLFNTACFEESLNRASWVLRQRQYMFRACVCNLSRHCTSLI